MHYLSKITYIGDPAKVVMPDGLYLDTLVASDIPVTDLNVFEFFS
jgi:hypothetical protein